MTEQTETTASGSGVRRWLTTAWRSKHPAWLLARVAVLVVVGLLGYVMFFEESFIYFPEAYPAGNWEVNTFRAGEGEPITRVEDVWMTTADGVRIHGWFCTPHLWRDGEAQPVAWRKVILWSHGNAGNISYRYDKLSRLTTAPAAVLIFDYRGYGRSEGKPSEQGLYADGEAAWQWLTQERGVAPADVVLYGVSLGAAVAIELATRVEAGGLIVESAFTSIADMATETMPFVPRAMIRTKMANLEKIAAVAEPVLVIHGSGDEIIPYHMGEALYEAAPEPKRFYEVPNATHNETHLMGGEAYLDAIRAFVLAPGG